MNIYSLIGKLISNIVIKKFQIPGLAIRTPDGKTTHLSNNSGKELGVININDWSFFWDVTIGFDLGMAKAYLEEKWNHSDLSNLFENISNQSEKTNFSYMQKIAPLKLYSIIWQSIKSSNNKKWAKKNVHSHYDISNKFFEIFLDSTMTYSCAIFNSKDVELEKAQETKINDLLRYSEIQSADSVLDIGCGWGSLSIKAAKDFEANVTGVTLSNNQYIYANKKVATEKLSDNVIIKYDDYRNITGKYDRIFSIEMLEAVGHTGVTDFFEKCANLLKDDGTLQIQIITIPDNKYESYKNNCDFIQKYVFPGGLLLSLDNIKNASEKFGFEITKKVEIGEHYAKTLSHWRDKLEQNFPNFSHHTLNTYDYKKFFYYFSYCEGGFLSKNISAYQITLKKS